MNINKPHTRRNKRQNGIDVETTIAVEVNGHSYLISARGCFVTGRPAHKKDPVWSLLRVDDNYTIGASGAARRHRHLLSSCLTYYQAIKTIKNLEGCDADQDTGV